MVERDKYIDFLRFLGITLIVIAHIDAPFTLTQLRTFDVPLMVFVSGLSYSGRSLKPSWSSFYWPRIKRIIVPVYIFLSFYFVFFYLLGLPLTWEKVINSYLLSTDGSIGYVWIMRVFLLIMIVTPLLCNINKHFNNTYFYLLLLAIFLSNCALVYVLEKYANTSSLIIIEETMPYLLGYSIFFLLGLRLKESKNKYGLLILVGVLFVFSYIILKANGLIDDAERGINSFKYPPTHVFILYGAVMCMTLWFLRNTLCYFANNRFVLFVGRNTIWIYLWHILFVILSYKLFDNWIVRYFFVYIGAISLYMVQYVVVKQLEKRYNWTCLKYLRG